MIIMLAIVGDRARRDLRASNGAFCPVFKKKFLASFANPPQTVSTIVAAKAEWQPQLKAIGSLRAVRGADLSAQVGGIVSAIHFESGADVQQGDLLVELSQRR